MFYTVSIYLKHLKNIILSGLSGSRIRSNFVVYKPTLIDTGTCMFDQQDEYFSDCIRRRVMCLAYSIVVKGCLDVL